jgi:hypothetical protein
MLALTSSVSATPTWINPVGGDGAGSDLATVLNTLYGAGNLQRIDDSVDQIWMEIDGGVKAEAKFAGNTPQKLGYYPGASGGIFTFIMDVTNNGPTGYNVAPSGTTTFLGSGGHDTFRFGLRSPGGSGPYWSSLQSDNSTDRSNDHMVTWKITGNTGHPDNVIGNYVIAWEDLAIGIPGRVDNGTDEDFQDLVVEVSTAAPIPEPGTLLLLGAGLVGLAGYGKLRLNRRKK